VKSIEELKNVTLQCGFTKNRIFINKLKTLIMKYTVVTSSRFEELIKQVNELIEVGWIPQGGICESGNGAIYHYSQAMIKK
jgi:hypothetical protein